MIILFSSQSGIFRGPFICTSLCVADAITKRREHGNLNCVALLDDFELINEKKKKETLNLRKKDEEGELP